MNLIRTQYPSTLHNSITIISSFCNAGYPMKNNYDIHDELYILFQTNGASIHHSKEAHSLPNDNLIRVKDLIEAPFNTYFLNVDSVNQRLNPCTAATIWKDNPDACLNKSIFDLAKKSCAEIIHSIDKSVLATRRAILTEEEIITQQDEIITNIITLKFPWFNANRKPQGIVGLSIIVGEQDAAAALQQWVKWGILPVALKEQTNMLSNSTYLSRRELQIASLLKRGKTAREIAIHLSLSRRTVEHYMHNMKIKLGVSKKSELVEALHEVI